MSRSALRTVSGLAAPILAVLAVAAVALPAQAGGPGGGRGGSGGHRPPPAPCCGHPGGNVNINVNAAAHAQASAYAGAQARSAIQARGWSGYSAGRTAVGGGAVYVGGGGYVAEGATYGGPVFYAATTPVAVSGPSAPFGYAVEGFGRHYGRGPAPWEVSRWSRTDEHVAVHREDVSTYRQDAYVYREDTPVRDRREWRGCESDGRGVRGREGGCSAYEARYPGWSEADAYAYWEGRAEDAYRIGYDDGRADCDCAPTPPRPVRPGPSHGHAERSYAPVPAAPPADLGYYGDLPPPGHAPPRAPHPTYGHPNQPGERG